MAPILEKVESKYYYDWSNNKLIFNLSSRSIDFLLEYINNPVSKFSINSDEKSLTVENNNTCYIVTLYSLDNKLQIKLTNSELQGLRPLLERAKVRIYGW